MRAPVAGPKVGGIFELATSIWWWRGRSRQPLLALALAANCVAGAQVALRGEAAALEVLAALSLCGFYTFALRDWRRALYGLLLFLPFTGVPTILLYPNTGLAALVKDVVFAVPAYLGFFGPWLQGRRPAGIPSGVMKLGALLVLLILVQALNPSLPNPWVGLIGLKVWLLYVPLCVIGYHLVSSRTALATLLRAICLAGLVPSLIGLAEAALIYGGRADLVYGFYGPAAAAATQAFAVTRFDGGGQLLRIPSTFSFVAQYNLFAASMVAAGYAWLRSGDEPLLARGGTWALFIIAALLTGSRGSFLMVALLLLLILLLDGRVGMLPVVTAAFGAALLAATSLLGATVGDVYAVALDLAATYTRETFLGGVTQALAFPLGLGTGASTNAARYAFASPQSFTSLTESWYAKALFELGVPGLILVVLFLAGLLHAALRARRRIDDGRLRGVSAALLALLIWTLVYSTKAQPLDIDPLNVYFWLFAGLLLRLPELAPAGADGMARSLHGVPQPVPVSPQLRPAGVSPPASSHSPAGYRPPLRRPYAPQAEAPW